jgi:hypothetical protein
LCRLVAEEADPYGATVGKNRLEDDLDVDRWCIDGNGCDRVEDVDGKCENVDSDGVSEVRRDSEETPEESVPRRDTVEEVSVEGLP